MEPNPLIITQSNADCVIGAAEGVAVAVWMLHTHARDVPALAEAAHVAQRGAPGRVKLIQMVPETAITPDGQARAALSRLLRGLLGVVSHSAILHEAEGFRAAMVRSIVTGIASLSNPGFPHRVFARLPEAAAWMCHDGARPRPLDGPALDAAHLESVVQRVRASGSGGASPLRLARERAPGLECR